MGLGVNARIAPLALEASAPEAPKDPLAQCNKTVGVSLLVCPDVRVLKGKTCVDLNGNRCRKLKVSIVGQNHVLLCAKKTPDLIQK